MRQVSDRLNGIFLLSFSITQLFDASDYRKADWRTEISRHILADPPWPAVTVWPLQRLCGRVWKRCVCPSNNTLVVCCRGLNLFLNPPLRSRPSDCRRLASWLLPHFCSVCHSSSGQRLLFALLGSHLCSLRPWWFQPAVWRLRTA